MVEQSSYRKIWVEEFGPIAKGAEIHHICENRKCRNLDHLVLCANGFDHKSQFHRKDPLPITNGRARRLVELFNSPDRSECQ